MKCVLFATGNCTIKFPGYSGHCNNIPFSISDSECTFKLNNVKLLDPNIPLPPLIVVRKKSWNLKFSEEIKSIKLNKCNICLS